MIVSALHGAGPCDVTTHVACQSHVFLVRLQDGFTVKSSSGAVFEDVDLSEKEWMDYDEKLGESIGIYDLEWKLQAVKL